MFYRVFLVFCGHAHVLGGSRQRAGRIWLLLAHGLVTTKRTKGVYASSAAAHGLQLPPIGGQHEKTTSSTPAHRNASVRLMVAGNAEHDYAAQHCPDTEHDHAAP